MAVRMNPKARYTIEERQGIALLVSAIVQHPVDCASATGSLIGGKEGPDVYQIMPGREVEFTSPVKEFWWESAYSNTQQFWESPIAAGLHYARHYVEFVKTRKSRPTV